MEREPIHLAATETNRVIEASGGDEVLDVEVDSDSKQEANPASGGVAASSPLKRRFRGEEMELQQKRQALPDSRASSYEENPAPSGDTSQHEQTSSSCVPRPAGPAASSDHANPQRQQAPGPENGPGSSVAFAFGARAPDEQPNVCASAQLLGEQLVQVDPLSLCVNRQPMNDVQTSIVERGTSVCVEQCSIGTYGSSCATQRTSRDRGGCVTHAWTIDAFDDNFSNATSNSLPEVSMSGSNAGDGQQAMPDANSYNSPRIDNLDVDDDLGAGIDLLDSYPGTNDYGNLSQIAIPPDMDSLVDTAILDTMLGPTRSADESMSNLLSVSVDMHGQVEPMHSLELRRLSNGSVNLASDCGDVQRQIVVDETLTNTILKDLICSICLEYFYFPVTIACGHTFCRYCIGHLRLAGKLCPLCRKEVGRPPNVNTILWNLVKSLKIRKRLPLPPAPRDMTVEEDKTWWEENCLKPFMSLPLFLRIMFGEIVQTPPFFDDVCICVVDYFDRHASWTKVKWVVTIEDCRLLRRLVGYDGSDMEGTSTRLHIWVENYLSSNPHLCVGMEDPFPYLIKVFSDVNHKIDGRTFNAMTMHHRLPWDAGRHVKSLMFFPHSSVSLSHLVFVPCGPGHMGLIDCGSTIGTMIKLQGQRAIQDGDRIHVGDKHELDVILSADNDCPDNDQYRWDPVRKEVVDVTSPELLTSEIVELEPIECPLKLRIFADAEDECEVWINPKGVVLGRGPQTQTTYRKLSITTQNGYISREHCLIYYDGSRSPGQRWILRDTSTLGTYLKIKPFQQPVPIEAGVMFKVGQCKVEVFNINDSLHRRVQNSSAAVILSQILQNHYASTVGALAPAEGEGTNVVHSNNAQPEE
ncbi:zinc finger protein, putative [Babesia caballi]|uniref:E3 ubiquitin-protein ligase CHFR n=1 Tax=Babesia caballi TaxID=5871 RepID=A0AAV4LY85_BABCB|nr:zinc finger protein, putative [Babesia caballi]